MTQERRFHFAPWMWFFLVLAFLLAVFNVDPVGDFLEKSFGKGADRWAINIIILVLILLTFRKKK
jgi:hypothetical protein